MKTFVLSLLLAACMATATAQYPTIPDTIAARAARQSAEIERRSDAAWAKALPIVEREARENNRPYRPWASKPEDLIQCAIPAFPGADGGGAYTAGGRGGKVLIVTSLADHGPGTLREACETGGARIIVFNVAGIIQLESPIILRAPYVTIAGQTAPGDGVCVTGASFLIDTHDVIIRHMRFRRGATDVAFRDDAIGGNAVGNIMVDHVSACWGLDENMSLYRHVYNRDPKSRQGEKLPTVNITIQNSIFSEALDLYNHAFGATIGGHNCLFARNLFASNISRNCSIGMNEDFNFVNNVIYNWWNRSVDGGDHTSRLNIINNNFKPGPITPKGEAISHRIVKMESGREPAYKNTYGKAYVHGNKVWGSPAVTADNWAGGVQIGGHSDTDGRTEELRAERPFSMPHATIMGADEAYDFVLENAGATLPRRDAVDARVIRSVKSGKAIYARDARPCEPLYVKRRLPADSYKQGIITNPQQVGGLPEYKGKPYADSDNDGMPDVWENRYGLNPHDPSDAGQDCNGDGYTNIEKYINGIDPTQKTDWTNPANNHDTLAEKGGVLR